MSSTYKKKQQSSEWIHTSYMVILDGKVMTQSLMDVLAAAMFDTKQS